MPTKKSRKRKTSARRDGALKVRVQVASRASAVPSARLLRKWARAALPASGDVTLRVVGAAEARRLNAAYRRRDYATNVLSFAYQDPTALSGDIVLCHPVIAREALEQEKSVRSHYAHMVVHGMLHLAGRDHLRPADARRMEAAEKRILRRLGIGDPYTIK
jgi:probable rRNA maturation factor